MKVINLGFYAYAASIFALKCWLIPLTLHSI